MFTVRLNNTTFIKKCLLNKSFIKTLTTSIQPVEKKTESESGNLKQYETLKNITRKTRTKKPQRKPFIKTLLIGDFDTEVLTYPEIEKEDLSDLESSVAPLEKLMHQSHMNNVDSLSNKNFRQNLSDYRAIGLQASQFMDGRDLNVSETSRFLEALTQHKLGDNILCNEQLGVQTLVKYGNDQLKSKYLYPIMKGEKLSAFCISEPNISDEKSFTTKAELSADKKTWILNGEKSWVVNGLSAEYLVVFAVTDVVSRDLIKDVKITAFLVEKDFAGITFKAKDTDLEIADIVFENTPVPCENVIGTIGHGDKIIKSILSDFRLSCGIPCITLTKNMLNKLSETIADQSSEKNLIYKTDAVRSIVGEITTNVYAMESMLYLTTGLLDWYENQDCDIESAVVKVFCSEKAFETSKLCLDLIGVPSIEISHWAQKMHKKCLNYITLFETNESLRMYIALNSLQYAGTELSELITKIRNPLYNGALILKRLWTNRRNVEDDPKLNLGLDGYLHPSLLVGSKHLEYCVRRLEYATESLLSTYGLEVVNKHRELRRYANCIIETYALTACLGRASRSYCIGLQCSDYEMLTANAFSISVKEKVQKLVLEITANEHQKNDENDKYIAKQQFKSKGYFFKHPLCRNF